MGTAGRQTGANRVACAALLGSALALFALAGTARAAQPIASVSVSASDTQAGAHPDLGLSLDLGPEPGEAARSVRIEWPTGLNLSPWTSLQCTPVELGAAECSPNSQIGVVTVHGDDGEGDHDHLLGAAALYSLLASPGDFGRVGFVVPTSGDVVEGAISLRSEGDYGVSMLLEGFSEDQALQALDLEVWGVPSGTDHDSERLPRGTSGCPGLTQATCAPPVRSPLPLAPFTQNPTYCPPPADSPSLQLSLNTYEDPANFTSEGDRYPAMTGCDQLSFLPSAAVTVTGHRVTAPVGVDLDLETPQAIAASFPSPSQLEELAVAFLGGVTVAEGSLLAKPACSAAEAAIGGTGQPACPSSALLAPAEIASPIVPEAISGGVYFGGPDPEGGFRLYLLASGYGVDLKLPLVLAVDAEEEDIAFLEFDPLPQLPLERIHIAFPADPSSPLATTALCGVYPIETYFGPWDRSLASQVMFGSHGIDAGADGGPCPVPGAGEAVPPSTQPPLSIRPPVPVLPLGARRAPTPPRVKIVKHPPRRSKRHWAKFAFSSSAAGVGFRCRLDRRRFRRCTSPILYWHLTLGRHRFRAYAVGPDGRRGKAVEFRFTTLRRKFGRADHRTHRTR